MRLLNTTSVTLEEHPDSRLPESGYAILSHRWYNAHEEVTFNDLQHSSDVSHKRGFAKLKGFCGLVRSMGYEFAWSDTCCINKESSTELGTALNSMFRWYREARVCIAFLEDVYDGGKRIEQSEWFERGWTLQELIAPKNLSFYDRDWAYIGTKTELLDILSSRTRIPASVLNHNVTDLATKLNSCSVAQRMSWAADRVTEREEDRAYSLMGLFDISLDMVYGEREKTFIRLQEKIIQSSADQSIFTWSLEEDNHPQGYSGLLAPSPSSFAGCSEVVKTNESRTFSLSNVGLSITLPTLPCSMQTYYAFLDCAKQGRPDSVYAIFVGRLPTENQYARIIIHGGNSLQLKKKSEVHRAGTVLRQICIRQTPAEAPLNHNLTYGFWLRKLEPPRHQTSRISVLSRAPTSDKDRVYMEPGTNGTAGVVSVDPLKSASGQWSRVRWIKVGFDDEFNPVLMLANSSGVLTTAKDFDAATTSDPGSPARSRLFESEWLRTGRLKRNQILLSPASGWPDGFSILVVENTHGAEYNFYALNLQIRVSLLPDYNLASNSLRHSRGPQSIWVVDLIDLKGTSPEWARHGEQCLACTKMIVGVPLAYIGCGWLWKEGYYELSEAC